MDEEFDELTRAMKEGVNVLKEVKHITEKFVSPFPKTQVVTSPIQASPSEEIPFVFTGQFTDMQYFQNNKILPHTTINSLPDEELKSAVVSNFEMAAKEGLIEIDKENHFMTLTEKGKTYISKPQFKEAARKDQLQAVAKLKNALNTTAIDATTQATTATVTTASNVASAATTAGNAVVGGVTIAAKTVSKAIQNM